MLIYIYYILLHLFIYIYVIICIIVLLIERHDFSIKFRRSSIESLHFTSKIKEEWSRTGGSSKLR